MNPTDVLWKRYQTRVDEASRAEGTLKARTAGQLHEDYTHLEHRIEKLTLICRAMWELLQKTHAWDEGTLFSLVKEIDSRDGTVDGHIQAKVMTCPECGHNVNSRHPVCVYCGCREFKSDPFSQV